MYGDPDGLDALAAEIAQRARDVYAAGAEHQREAERARWVSDAAAAYRRQVARDCADVHAAAEAMEQAAVLLRRHADELRQRLAEIARAEQAVRAWLSEQAARGDERFDDVAGLLGRLPEAGADAWRQASGRLSRLGLW